MYHRWHREVSYQQTNRVSSFSFYFSEYNVNEHEKKKYISLRFRIYQHNIMFYLRKYYYYCYMVTWYVTPTAHTYIFSTHSRSRCVIIVCLINDIAIHIKILYSLIFRLQRSISSSSLLFFFLSKSGTKLLIPFETSF